MRHASPYVHAVAVVLVAAATILVASPAVAADPASDFTYSVTGGSVTISNYVGGNTVVDIPATIVDGGTAYPVTTIATDAFRGFALTSVTIPNSVTTIGDNAFRGNLLTSIAIPDSVTSIGTYAFYNNDLTSVAIPDSITTISNNAFRGNALTLVSIPDSVTSIGNNSFNSNDLTSVSIPGTVTSIGAGSFVGNPLTSVIFGGTAPSTLSAAGAAGSLGTGVGLTAYYYAGASGFTSPWNGYATRAISAADSELAVAPVTPVTADGTTPATVTVTVRDDTHAPVAGVPVAFTVPSGVTASAAGCVTDVSGTCAVSVTSTLAATYGITAKIGADPSVLTQNVTFAGGSGTAVPTAPTNTDPAASTVPTLAPTGLNETAPIAFAGGLVALGLALLAAARIRRRQLYRN